MHAPTRHVWSQSASLCCGSHNSIIHTHTHTHCLSTSTGLPLRYNEWIGSIRVEDHNEKLYEMQSLVQRLPRGHFDTLKFISKFAFNVSKFEEENKMGVKNLALVFGPNLLWPYNDQLEGSIAGDTAAVSMIVEMMFTYADWFFPDEDGDLNPLATTYDAAAATAVAARKQPDAPATADTPTAAAERPAAPAAADKPTVVPPTFESDAAVEDAPHSPARSLQVPRSKTAPVRPPITDAVRRNTVSRSSTDSPTASPRPSRPTSVASLLATDEEAAVPAKAPVPTPARKPSESDDADGGADAADSLRPPRPGKYANGSDGSPLAAVERDASS